MIATVSRTATPGAGPFTALRSSARLQTGARYLAALAVCLLVLASVLDVRSETRMWPYFYQGDTMFYHLVAKSVIDDGWFLDVPRLGAPHTLNLRDVPTSDNNLHVLLLWLLSQTTSHYPSVLNDFFLLSFPLVFLSALWVLRQLGLAWWASVWASLLYTFAPFHFTRGEHHLFLSAYWPIPLAVLMILWVSREELWPERAARPAWRTWKPWLSVSICLVLAATGYYYAFFACFFLLVASVVASVQRRSWRGLWPGLVLIALISAGVLGNLSPSLLRFEEHGTVPAIERQAGDADRYALRIAQLLLPVAGHRIGALEDLKADYNRRPLINENDHASLGIAGALGFLGLLWWVFFRKPAADGVSQRGAAGSLHHLSVLNLAGVLFGTMGGFGSLVAFFGLPEVRAYNRISVFLSFFALTALAIWMDGMARRRVVGRTRQLAAGVALATVTALALADQISPKALPDYQKVKAQFFNDAAFVRAVEKQVPHGALIFQLPFATFPESPAIAAMKDYDLLRGYLHSSHLRWSYGTIKGREGNAWLRQTASKPLDELVETVAWAGFSGIYVDRNGFNDDGAEIEKKLSSVLRDVSMIHSLDRKLLFYNLTDYRARLEQRTPPDEREARRNAALHPPLTVWQDGFSDQEGTPQDGWRWGGSSGVMKLINRAARAQHVRLEMAVDVNDGGRLTVQTPLLGRPLSLDARDGKVVRTFALPPGEHLVQFASDARNVHPPNDFRDLVFRVHNFTLTPVRTEPPQTTP